MHSSLDCFPCFARQALDAARIVSDQPEMHEQILRRICLLASEMDLNQSPVVMGQAIHRMVKEVSGNPDPYRAIKSRFNQLALDLYPKVKRLVDQAPDPFDAAVRLAITGNSIDFGAYTSRDFNEASLHRMIDTVLLEPVSGDIAIFKQAVNRGGNILYLADNAGEIIFDRLLIERLPLDRLTVAVRGIPIINDATMEDARLAGITDLCTVIDNGSDAPGTLLDDCNKSFLGVFNQADLVIAKGQGNYETLSDVDNKAVFFLLKAKCPVIAAHLGCPVGRMIVMTGAHQS